MKGNRYYKAIIEGFDDPKKLSRVKVRVIPDQQNLEVSDLFWARIKLPLGSSRNEGFQLSLKLGDVVAVEYDMFTDSYPGGDPRYPLISGSWFGFDETGSFLNAPHEFIGGVDSMDGLFEPPEDSDFDIPQDSVPFQNTVFTKDGISIRVQDSEMTISHLKTKSFLGFDKKGSFALKAKTSIILESAKKLLLRTQDLVFEIAKDLSLKIGSFLIEVGAYVVRSSSFDVQTKSFKVTSDKFNVSSILGAIRLTSGERLLSDAKGSNLHKVRNDPSLNTQVNGTFIPSNQAAAGFASYLPNDPSTITQSYEILNSLGDLNYANSVCSRIIDASGNFIFTNSSTSSFSITASGQLSFVSVGGTVVVDPAGNFSFTTSAGASFSISADGTFSYSAPTASLAIDSSGGLTFSNTQGGSLNIASTITTISNGSNTLNTSLGLIIDGIIQFLNSRDLAITEYQTHLHANGNNGSPTGPPSLDGAGSPLQQSIAEQAQVQTTISLLNTEKANLASLVG